MVHLAVERGQVVEAEVAQPRPATGAGQYLHQLDCRLEEPGESLRRVFHDQALAQAGLLRGDTDRTIVGQLDIGEGKDPLEFALDVGIEETMFMFGVNKDIGRNWSLSAFLGLNGTRTQGTAMFGYRW